MKTISPYLNFDGRTEEAFNFYKSVFGGEFSSVQRFKEMPEMPGSERFPESDKNKLMHIALPIGKAGVIYGSDVPSTMRKMLTMGNNVQIMLEPESEEEAMRLFKALSAGGKVLMALDRMFWGALYADLTDKFGVKWMINYTLPK